MKKCPVCNSSKITVSDKGMSCKRCGYTHKTTRVINAELKNLRK